MSCITRNKASSSSTRGEEYPVPEVTTGHDTPQEPSTPHVGASSTSAHLTGPFTDQHFRQHFDISPRRWSTSLHGLISRPISAQDGLCNHCQKIALNDNRHGGHISKKGGSHLEFRQSHLRCNHERRTLSSIKKTAKKGCRFCQLMRWSFEKYCDLNSEHMNQTRILEVTGMGYRWMNGLQSFEVEFLSTLRQNKRQKQTMSFPITAHSGKTRKRAGPNVVTQLNKFPGPSASWLRISKRPRFDRLLSEDGAHLAHDVCERLSDWINYCIQNCDPHAESTVLPKRLLDVNPGNNGAEICLKEVGSLPQEPHVDSSRTCKYATLSHCWGGADTQPIMTTRANFDKMTAGISIEKLPRNYQDAVIVCRSLDIPFLWIDSLCIIQDDKEEWELEAQKIAYLYQQAWITIIPSAAESCDVGFLKRSQSPVKIQFRSLQSPQSSGSYFINEPDFSDTPLFYQDTAQTKWGNRGWTFIERLFSTRRIYFGKETIHWSCRSFYMSEIDNNPRGAEEYNIKSLTTEPGLGSGDNIYFFWCSQFLEYSCRQFTFWNDRLPAISALAGFIADITDDKWLAGIWESDMHIELLWSATRFRGPVALPGTSAYIAPSWSWLARARNAEISHISIPQNLSFITVSQSHIEPDGANPFGRVRDGYLELEGIVCVLSADNFHEVSEERSYICQEIRWENRYVGDYALDRDLIEEDQSPGASPSLNAGTFILLPIRNGLCLKRTRSRAGSEGITEDQVQSTISGLILVASGRADNEYCRAGIFESPPIESGGPTFFEGYPKQEIKII